MTPRTPPPLSPELEALLAPHRTPLSLAPSVESRALARAAAVAAAAERGAGRLFHPLRWAFAVAAVVVLALGAGAYAARAWIGARPSRAPVSVVPTASPRASEPPSVAGAPENDDEPAAAIAPAAAPHVRRVVGKAHPAGRPTNEELQLLRAAREDVTRGDFARALAVLSEHGRRFRNGVLVEEREALRVKSLTGLGRREEAQRVAADFHARFPHSVLLATFERMKESAR